MKFGYFLFLRRIGDRLVATHTEGHQWSSLYDYQFQYNYPASGIGAFVTRVEITVEQVN